MLHSNDEIISHDQENHFNFNCRVFSNFDLTKGIDLGSGR